MIWPRQIKRALLIHYNEGFERVIVVTKSDVTADDSFTDDDRDNIASGAKGNGNSSYTLKSLCCIYGNCSCLSLYSALSNLTSNVLINITTDVELYSAI